MSRSEKYLLFHFEDGAREPAFREESGGDADTCCLFFAIKGDTCCLCCAINREHSSCAFDDPAFHVKPETGLPRRIDLWVGLSVRKTGTHGDRAPKATVIGVPGTSCCARCCGDGTVTIRTDEGVEELALPECLVRYVPEVDLEGSPSQTATIGPLAQASAAKMVRP